MKWIIVVIGVLARSAFAADVEDAKNLMEAGRYARRSRSYYRKPKLGTLMPRN